MKATKTLKALDEMAGAIREAKACARRMHELSEQLRDNLDELDAQLRKVLEHQKLSEGAPEALRLFDRIPRLRELRNMMELGSLMIQTERAMDAVWGRLPK